CPGRCWSVRSDSPRSNTPRAVPRAPTWASGPRPSRSWCDASSRAPRPSNGDVRRRDGSKAGQLPETG
ncbi:MAG: hypothetical protein AVDCRST_MAG49-69, partial [uncultured Thermomicrobiales bacterium]